jgi:hypothetical protein
MAKFLTIDTGANGKFLIPADGFIFSRKESDIKTYIFLKNNTVFDTLVLTYDSVSGFDENALTKFIQDEMVELAQTHWTNAVVDITDRIPKPYNITNVSIA